MIQAPPEPPPVTWRLLAGTPFRPLWLAEDEVVESFYFEGHVYRIEANELLTRIASMQTLSRRREALKRLGWFDLGDWIDNEIENDIKMMIDGVRSRPVL